MSARWLLVVALMLIVCGCGRQAAFETAKKSPPIAPKMEPEPAAVVANEAQEPVAFQEPVGKEVKKTARKIKHSADLKLITDDFEKAKTALEKAIQAHQGYEAFADVQAASGTPRLGTWKVRVPIEEFAAFRGAVRQIGEIVSDTTHTEDLTEQYFDLEANIKNLRAEQESWRDMLKKTSDKVENVITVKRELDRVTDEIGRKEGRLRVLADLTELTTVNVQLRERTPFVPVQAPAPVEQATFGMRAGKAFADSWGKLVDVAQAVALLAIALAPWLPLILAAAVVLIVGYRRRMRTLATIVPPGAPAQG